jgi:biopolymer transport protein ExbD
MGEISQSADGTNSKFRSARTSVKIDMTPMVDLAFLLLTFFILTTTFNDPRVLELPMPDKGEPTEISANNVLNLVLAENNRVYWWVGLEGRVSSTNYSDKGLRQVLLDRKAVNAKTMVLIKPKDQSKYENMIDVLDEIRITSTQRYAIVDYTEEDERKCEELGIGN